jgi:DNA-binding CsgD family transcriptional regulator
MKTEKKTRLNPGFLNDVNNSHPNNSAIAAEQKQCDNEISENSPLLIFGGCLVDYSGRQFACIHEQCRMHNSCFKNEVQDGDFDFQSLHFHPKDKALLCNRIFPDILKFMDPIPITELPEYRFSFNHRYIRKNGSISQFLQEGTLTIPDDDSNPVLNLKVFTEIGDIKTDETMILTIFRYYVDQGYQKVHSKMYGETFESQLSQREMEIIKLCIEGLSSKMIADRLCLSIHTVKNHKRNCMDKTLTHNITELIHICQVKHWL